MKDEHRRQLDAGDGLKAGMPIAIGYLPIAVAFGLLARVAGVSLVEAFLFSSVVFAGASQFMALTLIQSGIGVPQIVLTTFLVNFRHLLMSASLGSRLVEGARRWLPLIGFWITDETFSVASVQKHSLTAPFMLAMEGLAYGSWVVGTIVGYVGGSLMPPLVQASMGVALYAMFIALLVPEAKRAISIGAIASMAGIAHYGLSKLSWLPSGWAMIAAIVISASIGALMLPREGE